MSDTAKSETTKSDDESFIDPEPLDPEPLAADLEDVVKAFPHGENEHPPSETDATAG